MDEIGESLNIADRFGFSEKKFSVLERDVRQLGNPYFKIPRLDDRDKILDNSGLIVAGARAIADLEKGKHADKPYLSAEEAVELSKKVTGSVDATVLLSLSRFLGEGMRGKVRRIIESTASVKLQASDEVRNINAFLNYIEARRRPREEFLDELSDFYEDVGRNTNDGVYLHQYLAEGNLFSVIKYPLISGVLRLTKTHVPSDEELSIVQPEILASVRGFLEKNGRQVGRNSFSEKSDYWKRQLAVVFKSDELEQGRAKVLKNLPNVLDDIYDLIPEDGPSFALGVRKQFENIAELDERGVPSKEIASRVILGKR